MRIVVLLVTLFTASTAASAASSSALKRKSGLWEIKISSAQAQGMPAMQQCVDEKSDDIMKGDPNQASCSKSEFRKEGERMIHETVCNIQGSTATTRSVFSGRLDSAYKVESKSVYEPPLHGMRETRTVIDAKWLGPCAPGQRAGDVLMPGMPNINMEDMMKNMPR